MTPDVLQDTKTEAAVGFAAGRLAYDQKPQTVEEGGTPFILLPDSEGALQVEALGGLLAKPLRIEESVSFYDVDSFAQYVEDFGGPATRIFACMSQNSIVAHLDYHTDTPSFDKHRAVLNCTFSDDWKAWTGINKQDRGQQQFALFVEEWDKNIIEPDGAAMLQLVSNLQQRKNVNFDSAIDLNQDLVQLKYEEKAETKGKGVFKVPTHLTLGIAPFKFSNPYEVGARLRVFVREANAIFKIELIKPEKVVEDAFRKVVDQVEKATTIKPYLTA